MIIDDSNGASPTNRYLGECPACELPIGREEPDGSSGQFLRIACPTCGRALKLERLFALSTGGPCAPGCLRATSSVCSCGCAGANHGKDWVVISVRDISQSALEAWREKRRIRQAVAKQAPGKRARMSQHQQWLEANADLIEAMTHLTRDRRVGVLSDMVEKAEHKILTQAQVDYAWALVDGIPAEAWEEAHFLGESDAANAVQHYIGTLNNPVTISGVVTKVHWMDDSFGGRKVIVVIHCTGEDAGAAIKISTGAKAFKALHRGDEVTVSGIVSEQKEYKGTMQTSLTRPQLAPREG